MKHQSEKTDDGPASPAITIRKLFPGIRLLLGGFRFGNELGQRHSQRLGQFFGDVKGGVTQTSFQHSNVGWMQIRLFGQRFLGKPLGLSLSSEHESESIRHFQAPHFDRMQRSWRTEHRQLYRIQSYGTFCLPSNRRASNIKRKILWSDESGKSSHAAGAKGSQLPKG